MEKMIKPAHNREKHDRVHAMTKANQTCRKTRSLLGVIMTPWHLNLINNISAL